MVKVFETKDELGRTKGIEFLLGEGQPQISHGISYVGVRERYKDWGDIMALDLPQQVFYTSNILNQHDFRRYNGDI